LTPSFTASPAGLETIIPFLNALLRKRLKILRVIPRKVSLELPDI
jgi:hypothetical protein